MANKTLIIKMDPSATFTGGSTASSGIATYNNKIITGVGVGSTNLTLNFASSKISSRTFNKVFNINVKNKYEAAKSELQTIFQEYNNVEICFSNADSETSDGYSYTGTRIFTSQYDLDYNFSANKSLKNNTYYKLGSASFSYSNINPICIITIKFILYYRSFYYDNDGVSSAYGDGSVAPIITIKYNLNNDNNVNLSQTNNTVRYHYGYDALNVSGVRFKNSSGVTILYNDVSITSYLNI